MHISNTQIQKVLDVHMHKVYSTASKARTFAAAGPDSLTLSSKAQDMQMAREVLAATPAVRSDLVESLRANVRSGDYGVSSTDLAAAMFNVATESRTNG